MLVIMIEQEQFSLRTLKLTGTLGVGSEAASEAQLDKLSKTVRFEQEAPSAAASSDPTVALEYPASGETHDPAGVRICAEVRSC